MTCRKAAGVSLDANGCRDYIKSRGNRVSFSVGIGGSFLGLFIDFGGTTGLDGG
jgi:hypothetical protein